MNDLFIPQMMLANEGYKDWRDAIAEIFKPHKVLDVEGYYDPLLLGYQITKLRLDK